MNTETECEPCYCGSTDIDHDECSCVNKLKKEKLLKLMAEQRGMTKE